MFQWSDLLLVVCGGYIVYKIGWVDGFSAMNLFLILAMLIAVLYTFLQRSGALTRFDEKKKQWKK